MTNTIDVIFSFDNSQSEIRWDKDCHRRFNNLLIENDRLFNVLEKVSYKAVIGLAATLTELIQQKSEKLFTHINTAKEFAPKIESLWVGAIDPHYLKTSEYGWKYFDENKTLLTPYAANWFVLGLMVYQYIESSFSIHRYLINLSMLARHLTTNKKLFDKWLSETLRKTAEVFPCTYDYADLNLDDVNARYDCSDDASVPREFFFDPEFKYSEEATKHVLNTFLRSLDYNNNPWLCTPEEMLAKGFKGTPYEV